MVSNCGKRSPTEGRAKTIPCNLRTTSHYRSTMEGEPRSRRRLLATTALTYVIWTMLVLLIIVVLVAFLSATKSPPSD